MYFVLYVGKDITNCLCIINSIIIKSINSIIKLYLKKINNVISTGVPMVCNTLKY